MDRAATGRLTHCFVLLKLALLASCLGDGDKGVTRNTLLAMVRLDVRPDVASEGSGQKLLLVLALAATPSVPSVPFPALMAGVQGLGALVLSCPLGGGGLRSTTTGAGRAPSKWWQRHGRRVWLMGISHALKGWAEAVVGDKAEYELFCAQVLPISNCAVTCKLEHSRVQVLAQPQLARVRVSDSDFSLLRRYWQVS